MYGVPSGMNTRHVYRVAGGMSTTVYVVPGEMNTRYVLCMLCQRNEYPTCIMYVMPGGMHTRHMYVVPGGINIGYVLCTL